MNMKDTNKIQLEMGLKKALKNKEFRLYYQPKIDLVSGNIASVESLIRWEHPEKGIILPIEFIPFAEESGLIEQIGEWVLRTACQQNRDWQDMGLPPMVIAVNLSARQLYQKNLVQMVQNTLEESKLAPEYLELEITESMMMDVQNVLPILWDLKRIGVKLALDDFGTGYSSLYYLKEFPIDKIKIDQSFVRSCISDMKDATIVKTIIAMAHQLKLQVVAEGVEMKEQLHFLQESLCNIAQGYLFSKPLPPEQLVENFHMIEQILKQEGIPQKLSKQKWLEEALEQARLELKETFRQQQGMIFKFIEDKGKFIYTLCDGELLYKMNLTPEQVVGMEVHALFPKENANKILKYYQRAWNGEEKITIEFELNGVWFLTSLRPILKGGKVIEVIGSSIDMTEKKEMEESLRLSELRFRAIAENTEDLICMVNEEGIVLYASPSHETLLGITPDVYEGNLAIDWVHSDDVEYILEQLTEIISTKTSRQVKFRFKNVQGCDVLVEARGNPVLDKQGEVEYVVVISRELTGTLTNHNDNSDILEQIKNITGRAKLERDLEDSLKKLTDVNFALNESSILAITNQKGIIEFVNDKFCEISKYSREELLGKDHRIVNSGYHSKEFFKKMWQTIGNGKPWGGEIRNKAKDGSFYWVYTTIVPFLNSKGKPYQYVSIRTDITKTKKVEEALRKSEESYQLISENMTDLICIIDQNGLFEYASPSHEQILGLPSETYGGISAKIWMHHEDIPIVGRHLEEMVVSKEGCTFEFRFRDTNYNWVWFEAKATPIFDDEGQFEHFIVVSREITERKMYEEKLAHMAFHDSLTDLPNRRILKEKLIQSIKEAKRYKRKMAVMYLDIDRFKHINDTFGHDIGDALLKQFAKRVSGCLRESDTLARQGGDEFTILLPKISVEQDAINIINRIINTLQEPWHIGEHVFKTTSSIGVAFYPNDGTNRYELLGNADSALYYAKKSGRNNYKLFSTINQES